MLTETIQPNDPRAWKLDEEKQKEIAGLLERKTWKAVLRRKVSKVPNILKGRIVLAIKDNGTDNEIWKCILVVQGYRNSMNKSLVYDISMAKEHTTKMLVGLAAVFGFRIFQVMLLQHTYRVPRSCKDIHSLIRGRTQSKSISAS